MSGTPTNSAAFLTIVVTMLTLLCGTPLCGAERVFTNTEGQTVKATVLGVDNENVQLRVRSRMYTWPLNKLSAADRVYLQQWKREHEAARAERLKKVVGAFPKHKLLLRAYTKPEDYLGGEMFETYLNRVAPQYRTDSLEGLDYDIADQTAALYVPPNYDESTPFGVYVEVSSSPHGQVPRGETARVFEKHRLLYICPQGAGNSKILSFRMGLALDALASVKASYRIDSKQCYIGGVSGGGVSSTMICYLRPEVFRGAINIARGALLEPYAIQESVTFLGGTRSYEKGQTYPAFLPHVARQHATLSRRFQDKRWAFVSGEKDFNYEFTKASGEQWIKHGYRAKYFHVPGMGHTDPPAKTLDQVFAWMKQ